MQKTVNSNHGLVLFNPKIGPYQVLPLLGQTRPGSDGNKWVLHILQRSSITRTSQSDSRAIFPHQCKLLCWSTAEFYHICTGPMDDRDEWWERIREDINLLHLCWLLQWVSWYDTKKSDGEASVVLELWEMQRTSLLPSLPGLTLAQSGCTW